MLFKTTSKFNCGKEDTSAHFKPKASFVTFDLRAVEQELIVPLC
jgi:hypothetical protein